ncbi:MAG: DUF448 domain-containing protein [Desulfonauticus sp.]|nr:DUF448 domain-containing protein [Desulfonauticus sp.]
MCKKKAAKQELVRFVCRQDKNGKLVLIKDMNQIMPGRGYYVCSPECEKKLSTFKGWLKKCKGVKK